MLHMLRSAKLCENIRKACPPQPQGTYLKDCLTPVFGTSPNYLFLHESGLPGLDAAGISSVPHSKVHTPYAPALDDTKYVRNTAPPSPIHVIN